MFTVNLKPTICKQNFCQIGNTDQRHHQWSTVKRFDSQITLAVLKRLFLSFEVGGDLA